MSGYVPNILDPDHPTDAQFAESATAEFRGIKGAADFNLYRNTTIVGVSNTAVTTNLMPDFVVAGGVLRTNKRIKLKMYGVYVNNTGSSQTYTFIISYGGTSIFTAIATLVTAAGFGAWELDVDLGNSGVTNNQTVFSKVSFWTVPSSENFVNILLPGYPLATAVTVHTTDSTVAQNLTATITLGAASVDLGITVNTSDVSFY